jgi:hypothetical protein
MRSMEDRKRLMLLALPLLLLPLLALAFFALGGGKDELGKAAGGRSAGLNAELPGASFKKEKKEDKFSLYEQAQRDSAGKHGGLGGAFSALGWDTAAYRKNEAVKSGGSSGSIRSGGGYNSAKENELKIKQKLAEIDKQVHAPPVTVRPVAPALAVPANNSSALELARLEKMLKQQQGGIGAPAADPELERLNGMLDKIVQIQNPSSGKGVAPVQVKPVAKDSVFRAVPAVVEGNQKVLQGGMVKLRLTDSLVLGGLHFPKGQLLFGSCTITNQRLLLDIRNIRLGTAIVPVSLTVFSLDGMQGINAPEAELGEAAGQGTTNALDNMEFLGMDQSLATQAATAGISAAKSLIGKKVRRVKVRLRGGYPVLLRNNGARK